MKLGLMSLLGPVSNKHIRIMSDNTTAFSYINAIGGGGGDAAIRNAILLLRKFDYGP